jgi:hypothetical protein
MTSLDLVDDLYAAFADTLHESLRTFALRLPFVLGVAPEPGVPWSRVFPYEVTLAAPVLFAEAAPDLPSAIVRDATMAHMLAVIEAFGSDRVDTGRVHFTPELMAVLGHMRRARDRAVVRVCPQGVDLRCDFALADREAAAAIREERMLLLRGLGAPIRAYEAAALGKQSIGFPASLALGHAAGWDCRRIRAVRATLANVALGMQIHEDVVDWEHAHGGTWVVALARRIQANRGLGAAGHDLDDLRKVVLDSGVLPELVGRARRHFRAAHRLALVLGARKLALWAKGREDRESLVPAKDLEPDYSLGAHVLAAWAPVSRLRAELV